MVRRTILALATFATIAPAAAAPRTDPTSGRAVFTGATLPSAPSVSLNPAALGLGSVGEFFFALTGVLEQFGIDRRLIAPDGTLSNGPKVTSTVPGAGATIGGVWHPGNITAIGAELRTPPPELFPDDPALRYHSLGSYQRNYILTGGVSFKVTDEFYFGVSIAHDVTVLRQRFDRDTALDRGLGADCNGAPCGLENPVAAERYDVDVSSNDCSISTPGKCPSADNLEVNLGILIHPTPNIWFGAAYHNTPGFGIQTQLTGGLTVTRAPRDGGEILKGSSSVLVSFPASVDGELRVRVLPDLDLHLGGRWIDLSRMQAYDVRAYGNQFLQNNIPESTLVPRGFHDSFSLWVGAEQVEIDQRKRIRLGARLGFETAALTANRTSPNNDSPASITADVGVQIRLAPKWSLQISYGIQVFSAVSVENSDYNPLFAVECADNGFDYSTKACQALRDGYAIPTAAGDYSRIQHAMRLGLRREL